MNGFFARYKYSLLTVVSVAVLVAVIGVFLFPKMKDPYYTWEGKIVELASLKYRELPPVKESPWPDDMR